MILNEAPHQLGLGRQLAAVGSTPREARRRLQLLDPRCDFCLPETPRAEHHNWRTRRRKRPPFSSPRLFAGRGRVRGVGDWPHVFN